MQAEKAAAAEYAQGLKSPNKESDGPTALMPSRRRGNFKAAHEGYWLMDVYSKEA